MHSLYPVFAVFFASVLAEEYSDEVARYQYFPLFSAAFIDQPQKCLDNTWPNMKVYNIIDINNCSASGPLNEAEKILALSFRGTQGTIQLVEEALSELVPHMDFFDSGRIFAYFYEAFLSLWSSGVSKDIRTLKYLYPDFTLYVTGHSLGGAMASIAASYLVKIGLYKPEQIKLMTFGQPRTGDVNFAEWHDSTFPYSYRVVHHKDIVPHIAPQIDVIGGDTMQHHKTEIWYNNEMTPEDTYEVCKYDDGLHCSNLQIDLSWDDHMLYFNHSLDTWPELNCVKDF